MSTGTTAPARRVILSMQVSLDGYVADDDGTIGWAEENFDGELLAALADDLARVDTMLMGRVNYLEQAAFWPTATDPLADIVNAHSKIVFSSTLPRVDWQNARLATMDPAAEIARLRSEPGLAIGVSGGARFAQSLLADGLIDEIVLTVHPVARGRGIPLFTEPQGLELLGSRRFASGVLRSSFRVT